LIFIRKTCVKNSIPICFLLLLRTHHSNHLTSDQEEGIAAVYFPAILVEVLAVVGTDGLYLSPPTLFVHTIVQGYPTPLDCRCVGGAVKQAVVHPPQARA